MPNTYISDQDIYLFNEGRQLRLYDHLGAHPVSAEAAGGQAGCRFAVWAPNAEYVSVVGDWNFWDRSSHPLKVRGSSGVWEGVVPWASPGQKYKYFIRSRSSGYQVEKADPVGFAAEIPPGKASVICDLEYQWGDGEFMGRRAELNRLDRPLAIYEVHLGSWRRCPEEGNRSLSYRELGPKLADYAQRMGYTHLELLPVMEHPFYGSWGYQITGFFAATSRYGSPQDLMYLIDYLHQRGLGVILDWVPSHFPSDEHGLGYFDGTHLYEHADARQGIHPEWKSLIFNYGRREVRSFLLSSALFWLDRYHVDGLRVDGVASMLYLDYGRKAGQWIPNERGGRENLQAVHFLQSLNQDVYRLHPDVQTMAEESTSWPQVTRPVESGGLGFGLKWDMGWMHDTLDYLTEDPVHRQYHHKQLTFRMMYAYSENYVLALSHDEVVHLKKSLYRKMAGDPWQKCANLRLLFGYMYSQPGKKLTFMGGEFGQTGEWNHDASLEWHLVEGPGAESSPHAGVQRFVAELNHLYQREPALWARDYDPEGFAWLEPDDKAHSVLAFLRRGHKPEETLLIACNFTPVPRSEYHLGVPAAGRWVEILNSDAPQYGGGGQGNLGACEATEEPHQKQPASLKALLPPLGIVIFKRAGTGG